MFFAFAYATVIFIVGKEKVIFIMIEGMKKSAYLPFTILSFMFRCHVISQ